MQSFFFPPDVMNTQLVYLHMLCRCQLALGWDRGRGSARKRSISTREAIFGGSLAVMASPGVIIVAMFLQVTVPTVARKELHSPQQRSCKVPLLILILSKLLLLLILSLLLFILGGLGWTG